MLAVVKESLKLQSECPKCKVSWKCLEECLHEPAGSENRMIASFIIDGCAVCSERFAEVL
jgi:Pyruvate/2-oxoacid:ferredoxin oxidoreductase delta subunit